MNTRLFKGTLCGLLAAGFIGSAQAVVFVGQGNIQFVPDSTNALIGLTGTPGGQFGVAENSLIGLTTNTDNQALPAPIFGQDGLGVTSSITYDLGALGAATRQLDTLTIWTPVFDRPSIDAALYFSLDGIDFTYIGNTYVGWQFATDPQSDQFNKLTYTFDPGEVVGFRYLRVENPVTNFQSFRSSEIQATVSVPEPSTIALASCVGVGAVFMALRKRRLS